MQLPLTEQTFLLFAAKYYDNPQCFDIEEFYADLKRINYIQRLLKKYHETGELKERLILNHLRILYNLFDVHATQMLFFRIDETFYPYLKPFLLLMGYMPKTIQKDTDFINSDSISMDTKILEVLKSL